MRRFWKYLYTKCSGLWYSWDFCNCRGIFLSVRGSLRNMEMSWDFSTKTCQFCKVIILIPRLFGNSLGEDIKKSQVSHQHRLHVFSFYSPQDEVYGYSKKYLLLSCCLADCNFLNSATVIKDAEIAGET